MSRYSYLTDKHVLICNWIEESLSIKSNFNRDINSYGLKHICETDIKLYIANYEFVYCMLVCGFKTKKCYMNSPNFYFNFNFKHKYLSKE